MSDTIEIDAEGDVVLVCGEGTEQYVFRRLPSTFTFMPWLIRRRKRLRVHSALMTRASSVFKALLSPRFREGTELSTTGAVEVAFPEDDGNAMATICYIIHYQASKTEQPKYLPDLIKVAQLSDKYDLNEVMKLHAQGWLLDRLQLSDKGDLADDVAVRESNDRDREWILAAAYYFGLESVFRKAGIHIVVRSTIQASKGRSEIERVVSATVTDVLRE